VHQEGFVVTMPQTAESLKGHFPVTQHTVNYSLIPYILLGEKWFYRSQLIAASTYLGTFHTKVVVYPSDGSQYYTLDDHNTVENKVGEDWGGYVASAMYLQLRDGLKFFCPIN